MSFQKISDFTPYYQVDLYWIPGTNDAFKIGTNGMVYSRWAYYGYGRWKISGVTDIRDFRSLRPGLTKHKGYPYVALKMANGKRKNKLISHLVLEAVIGPCPYGMEACHVYDPNPLNNWSWNLKWGTHEENEFMKRDHGTLPDWRGEGSPNAKLNWTLVRALRADWKTRKYVQRELGVKYGIDTASVSKIVNNKQWIEITPESQP